MTDIQQTGVPVQYVGKKQEKVDNVAGTGLTWTPGQIHGVPPVAAQQLAKHADVWKIVGWDDVDADPAKFGVIVDSQPPTGLSDGDSKKPEGQQQVEPQTLPNLHGMTKPDLQSYAESQFNQKLDPAMKKEVMIEQIVALANRAAVTEVVQ